MKKIKWGFICTIFVLLLFRGVSGKAFDGLEGVVILNPDDDSSSKSDVDTNQEGLVLSVEECNIECIDEIYSNIVLRTTLMNWNTEEYQIGDVISARLYYQEMYEYDATIDFAGESRIGMLVNLGGEIVFTVPNIVAMADKEDLRLEISILDESYDENVDIINASAQVFAEIEMPFDYKMRNSDGLEFSLGSAYITDSWKGEKDEKYKWIIQEIYLINWAQSRKEVENSIYSMLKYMDIYGFEAQVILPQQELNTLEVVKGQLVYHIPLVVSTAEKGTLILEIELLDETWDEVFDLNNLASEDYWDLLRAVFPYESENAVKEIDMYAAGNAENILAWNNHFYLIVEVSSSDGYYYRWDEAKEYCEQMGGYLVTITSVEEQQIIEEYIESTGEYTHYWLGGYTDENANEEWKWITGESMEYSNWKDGEPNQSGDYLEMYDSGFWDDTYNTNQDVKGYICEWDF